MTFSIKEKTMVSHGSENFYRQKSGNRFYFKRVKFCQRHGWIEIGFVGGAEKWEASHGVCENAEEHPVRALARELIENAPKTYERSNFAQ